MSVTAEEETGNHIQAPGNVILKFIEEKVGIDQHTYLKLPRRQLYIQCK